MKIGSARSGMAGRIRRALAFGVLAVALAQAACVRSLGVHSYDTPSGAPGQGAGAASLAAPPSLELARFDPSAEGVEIAPLEGTAVPMAKLLQRSVAAALGRYNVPASYSSGAARYLLSGHAGSNRDPAQAAVVAIEWRIFDRRQGRETGRFTLPVAGDHFAWDHGDPRVIAQVGDETSHRFVQIIDGERPVAAVSHGPPAMLAAPFPATALAPPSVPPSAPPPSARTAAGPKLFLARVGGAPGDGDAALAQAARAAFAVGGFGTAAGREDARYIIAGSVDVAAPAEGRQAIRIVWEVSTPDGRPLGRAVQENAVPAGSLNGAWGPMASLVAGAAVAGISNVIRRSE
ncbi:MAG: hypothetical protein EXR02_02635 [Rhodospirillales bacterium]|nr:hypothetical protein [Rhodospirillales bacterium]MSP79946.1 hypothetical protein [Rhodospirillales bacterium]